MEKFIKKALLTGCLLTMSLFVVSGCSNAEVDIKDVQEEKLSIKEKKRQIQEELKREEERIAQIHAEKDVEFKEADEIVLQYMTAFANKDYEGRLNHTLEGSRHYEFLHKEMNKKSIFPDMKDTTFFDSNVYFYFYDRNHSLYDELGKLYYHFQYEYKDVLNKTVVIARQLAVVQDDAGNWKVETSNGFIDYPEGYSEYPEYVVKHMFVVDETKVKNKEVLKKAEKR